MYLVLHSMFASGPLDYVAVPVTNTNDLNKVNFGVDITLTKQQQPLFSTTTSTTSRHV